MLGAASRYAGAWVVAFLSSGCFGGSTASATGGKADGGAMDVAAAEVADADAASTAPSVGDADAAAMDVANASILDVMLVDSPTDSRSDTVLVCADAGVDDAGQGFCGGARIGLLGVPGPNASSDFQAWLGSNGQVVTRLPTATTITVDVLSSFDVVIIDQLQRDYSSTEADALRDWVAGGGGVMSMTDYTGSGPDRTQPNTLLASIGLQYLPGLLNGPVTMFVTHPTNAGLTSVTFQGGYAVGPVSGISGGVNTVTANLTAGPAVIAQERGNGRVFAWGDEWVEYDSEWQSIPEIRQFWIDVLGWLEHLR